MSQLKIEIQKAEFKKIIIVVGTTGTGKSTIINMLFNDDFNKDACSSPCIIGSTADSVTKKNSGY